ncbi:hypothetical protein DRN69_02660 [Candidatus Pacearchaeota archaeon]|nr:MAG: hypothetical protein DRN69_02660 [Candidatus Pacearchaeota archaeon]
MTEKNYNPKQKEKKSMEKQEKINKKKEKVAETPEKQEEAKEKKEDKKEQSPQPAKKETKTKKTYAIVNAFSLPVSTKKAVAICKFIKGKKIERAVSELENASKFKVAVPMKGEIPHRKGKIMSGRYPKKAIGYFIKLLKSLHSNANMNSLEKPIITEAIANIASRPYSRFGRVRRKRTHIQIKVEDNIKKKNGREKRSSV